MRLAVLHHSLTGYWNICLKGLHEQDDVSIFIAHHRIDPNTPFDDAMFSWIDTRYEWHRKPDSDLLLKKVREFKPDVLLTLGWHIGAYRRVAKALKGQARRILYFENTWRGTPKQWLGIMVSPWHVRPLAEYAWVQGSRQREFARRLGFGALDIMDGALSGDTRLFQSAGRRRANLAVKPKAFLFVGRLVPVKGVAALLEGYTQYRSRCTNPWPLICVGAGPLQNAVLATPGVVSPGFLQPEPLAERMLDASVFVLPSLFEPWGVVVHEAAAAGLPMIVSEVVGSHVHLVQSGFNGYIVEAGSAESLAEAMLRFHQMDEDALTRMGDASRQLAEQYTPERWITMFRQVAGGDREAKEASSPTLAV